MSMSPNLATVPFTVERLTRWIFDAEERVKGYRESVRIFAALEEALPTDTYRAARPEILRLHGLVEIGLRAARADVLIGEAWLVGVEDTIEIASRRYIDATLAGVPFDGIDVWVLGFAGEDDLPPQRADEEKFTLAECAFLRAIGPHVGKTCDVSAVREAVEMLRASVRSEAA